MCFSLRICPCLLNTSCNTDCLNKMIFDCSGYWLITKRHPHSRLHWKSSLFWRVLNWFPARSSLIFTCFYLIFFYKNCLLINCTTAGPGELINSLCRKIKGCIDYYFFNNLYTYRVAFFCEYHARFKFNLPWSKDSFLHIYIIVYRFGKSLKMSMKQYLNNLIFFPLIIFFSGVVECKQTLQCEKKSYLAVCLHSFLFTV